MATVAVGWLEIPRLGYRDDFGIIATEATGQDDLGFRAQGSGVSMGREG